MGGGNGRIGCDKESVRGLSPRGRGKPRQRRRRPEPQRSIPAWAGETLPAGSPAAPLRVYPRVGGGNLREPGYPGAHRGLSPRGRGKLYPLTESPPSRRSIPAWAGETDALELLHRFVQVYPRVGGGNMLQWVNLRDECGLSPRGRGKRLAGDDGLVQAGSIPAWAGETSMSLEDWIFAKVYPRVGGGNLGRVRAGNAYGGLSPRGRGKPSSDYHLTENSRSIPAWAGETVALQELACGAPVYPRVGGGNLDRSDPGHGHGGLSPRGRGKPAALFLPAPCSGSIPAWAGETPMPWPASPPSAVYPRVGGGNVVTPGSDGTAKGLSPRGRGKPSRS